MTDKLDADMCDIIILIQGKTATDDEAEALAKGLEEKYPDVEIITMNGGQDIYDFILIYE
jgi:dihydroxyacetone kinase-like predicted kinase